MHQDYLKMTSILFSSPAILATATVSLCHRFREQSERARGESSSDRDRSRSRRNSPHHEPNGVNIENPGPSGSRQSGMEHGNEHLSKKKFQAFG